MAKRHHHHDVIDACAVLQMFREQGIELELRAVIARHIDWVVDAAGGNRSAAASALGINRRSLQRRDARIKRPRAQRRGGDPIAAIIRGALRKGGR